MRLFVVFILHLIASACSPASQNSADRHEKVLEKAGVSVTVFQSGGGQWTADYEFAKPQSIMFFSRSNGNYRVDSWRAETSGVTLKNLNGFDTMIFDEPSQSARFVFTPHTQDVPKDYTPFIPFTDGGMAIFTDQFDLLTAASESEVINLSGKLMQWKGDQPELEVKILSDQSIVHNGEILKKQAVIRGIGKGTYIYVGNADITVGQDFAGIVDSGLPEWIANRFDQDLTDIFDGHRLLWKDGLERKTTVLFAFRGYHGDGFHNNGGAVGNLLALETFGNSLKQETHDILAHFHWFFAHEAAHLFQNRSRKVQENPNVAWIDEGAANAMAYLVLQEQGLAPKGYILEQYKTEFADCTAYLEDHVLQDAASLGRYNAYYSCGNLMAHITASSLQNASLFNFWNTLLNQDHDRNKFSSAQYFDTMQMLGAPEDIIEKLQFLSSKNVENPKRFLADLMRSSGMKVQFDEGGNLSEIVLP